MPYPSLFDMHETAVNLLICLPDFSSGHSSAGFLFVHLPPFAERFRERGARPENISQQFSAE